MPHATLNPEPRPDRPADADAHRPRAVDRELAVLMRAVRSGDEIAWTRLVTRFDRGLRNIARTYRLSPSDIDDVMQATWLRLFKHVTKLRDPNAIAGWLATTTRRECLRKLQHPVREYPTDDPRLGDRAEFVGPEDELLAADRHAVLMRALETLPERQRQLMTALAEPDATYQSISRTLGSPSEASGPSGLGASPAWSTTPSCKAFGRVPVRRAQAVPRPAGAQRDPARPAHRDRVGGRAPGVRLRLGRDRVRDPR